MCPTNSSSETPGQIGLALSPGIISRLSRLLNRVRNFRLREPLRPMSAAFVDERMGEMSATSQVTSTECAAGCTCTPYSVLVRPSANSKRVVVYIHRDPCRLKFSGGYGSSGLVVLRSKHTTQKEVPLDMFPST